VALLRRALNLHAGFAILGGVLLSSLNALQFQADIGKLTAVHFYPVLILLLWTSLNTHANSGWKSILPLAGFAAGLGLLFFTSYYPAWFFLLTLGIFGLVALAAKIMAEGPRAALDKVGSRLAELRWQVIAALAVFGVSLLPLIRTYAPLIRAEATRSFDLVLEFAPRLRDVVNVSANNYVWSPFLGGLGYDFGSREAQMGSPILVLLLFGLAALILVWRLRNPGWSRFSKRQRFMLLLTGTAVALLAISVKWDGFSLWYFVYTTIPGASALRALGRVLILVDMIAIVVVICGADDVFGSWNPANWRAAAVRIAGAALTGTLLIAEQVNSTPFRLDKAGQLAFMRSYPAPPAVCRAFFVNNARTADWPFGYYQLDAMMISMQLGVPTVNGYSGIEPHEAFTLRTRGVEYKYRILDWLQSRQATSAVCELDLQTAAFVPTDVALELPAYRQLYLASLVEMFSALHDAASRFLADGNALSDLHPRFLEEHGYLDAALGYEQGTRYKWLQDRYWIGERPCGRSGCFGIGIVGNYADVEAILEAFGDEAFRVLYPSPEAWGAGQPVPENLSGELLMIFAAEDYRP
jgi:hypothetical protein